MRFAKLCCGGNDFIIICGADAPPPGELPELARRLCARRWGIGADGLIVLSPHTALPFRIGLINADGSRAEVSFNGSRCVGLYAHAEGLVPAEFSFASEAGDIHVKVDGRNVSLQVPPPKEFRASMELEVGGEQVVGHFIRVGVPYFVIFQDDLNYTWIDRVPPRVRTHTAFPNGTNVAVAQRRSKSIYEARFFERGVAEETLSSGSGCVAVALVAALSLKAASPVRVITKGGDFSVEFRQERQSFSQVLTGGEVVFIYRGEIPSGAVAEIGPLKPSRASGGKKAR
jgi:diaminopimelate epimerase